MNNAPALWITYPTWMWPILIIGFIALALATLVFQGTRPKYRAIYGSKAMLMSAKNLPLSFPGWLYQWTALTLVLLPWWWASVLISYVLITGLSINVTPTAVFLLGLVAVYCGFLIRGFFFSSVNEKFRSTLETDNQPATSLKKVAVIGAGMAGLVAAKELKEEGHEVVVFDRTEGWGGVWASSKKRGGRSWGSTLTSTGALNTTFSDCPVPIYNEANGAIPLHYTRQQFMDMLQAYESRHQVFSGCLRTNTDVTGMERSADDKWRVSSTNAEGVKTDEEFDAVTVCTGLNHEPWTPSFEGLGSFEGLETHVDNYDFNDPKKFAGKNVLVVGAGETAADISKDLADNGVKQIYVAPRGSTITLSRAFASVPPDYNENRFTYSGPMFNRWGILITGLTTMLTNVIKPTRVKPFGFIAWYKIARLHETIKDFPAILGSVNATKSDNLWSVIDSGIAELVPGIKAITPNGARLKNKRELDVDAIIYCTGYRTKNAFIPQISGGEATEKPLTVQDLYKLMIHPELHNVAFIGYARGMVGAITLSSELQARWWALLVSGKRQLPSEKEMQQHVIYLSSKTKRFSRATRTTMTYASSLARHDIGCEPDMFALFRHDKELWWQVWNGAICAAHFRLFGVRAKHELAREQLLMPGSLHATRYIDAVDVAYNLIPLAAFSIPLWAVLEKLVPTFFTRSSLGSYS